ncbi:hypothetical protein TWF506_007343 [Arthrobotrys conoides]|uniref:Uncharacterized protein n=1 Tax=Arthrobotrys conoides TaxID=74498 RepID=A0AAN8NAD9_9PEZI
MVAPLDVTVLLLMVLPVLVLPDMGSSRHGNGNNTGHGSNNTGHSSNNTGHGSSSYSPSSGRYGSEYRGSEYRGSGYRGHENRGGSEYRGRGRGHRGHDNRGPVPQGHPSHQNVSGYPNVSYPQQPFHKKT